MKFVIHAACGCQTGKVRKNNEDNFYFDGKFLEQENLGLEHPICCTRTLRQKLCMAIFDGMGGENFGGLAAYVAARQLQQAKRVFADFFISDRAYLEKLTQQLNEAVSSAQAEMCTDRMGTTMVGLYFSGRYVYACNVGDSRAYQLRNGEFLQLSVDHVEKRPERNNKKAPLTQYLGYGNDDIQIEPHIAQGEIQKGDVYLLCSDGLTDMLTDLEISDIMLKSEHAENCVQELIQAALEHGGRDNITAIVCKLI